MRQRNLTSNSGVEYQPLLSWLVKLPALKYPPDIIRGGTLGGVGCGGGAKWYYHLWNVCIPGFSLKPRGVYISARSLTEETALKMGIFQPSMIVYQRVAYNSTRWWFHFFLHFQPGEKWSNLTVAYVSNGLGNQPPPRIPWYCQIMMKGCTQTPKRNAGRIDEVCLVGGQV